MAIPVQSQRIAKQRQSEMSNTSKDPHTQLVTPLSSAGFSVSYANQTVGSTSSMSLSRSSIPTYNNNNNNNNENALPPIHEETMNTPTPESAARVHTDAEHRCFSGNTSAVLATIKDNTPYSRHLSIYSQDPSPMPLKPRRTNHAAEMMKDIKSDKMAIGVDVEGTYNISQKHSNGGVHMYHRKSATTLQESLLQSASQPGSRPWTSVSAHSTTEAAARGRISSGTTSSTSHVTIAGRPPLRLAGMSVGNMANKQCTATTITPTYCDPMSMSENVLIGRQTKDGTSNVSRESTETYSLARPDNMSTSTKTSFSRSPLFDRTPDVLFRDTEESSPIRNSGKKQPRNRRSHNSQSNMQLRSPQQSPSMEAVGGMMRQLNVDRGRSTDSSLYAPPTRPSHMWGMHTSATYGTYGVQANDSVASLIAPTRCKSGPPDNGVLKGCNNAHTAHSEDSNATSSDNEDQQESEKESVSAIRCDESEEDNFQPDSENEDDHYSAGRHNTRMRYDGNTRNSESPSVRNQYLPFTSNVHSGNPNTKLINKPFITSGSVDKATSQTHNNVSLSGSMRHAASLLSQHKDLSSLPTHFSLMNSAFSQPHMSATSSMGSVPILQGDASYIYTPSIGNATPSSLPAHHAVGQLTYSLGSVPCSQHHPHGLFSSQSNVFPSSPNTGMVSPLSQCSFLKRNDSMQYSNGYGLSTPLTAIMPRSINDHSSMMTLNAHNQDEISVFKANKMLVEFREISPLGQGNFGKALLVEENATGHYFAIKVSAPMMSSREEQKLKQERNILFAIRGSPHCATLYDSWAEGTSNSNRHLYLKMHWYERGSVTNLAIERRNIKTVFLNEYAKQSKEEKNEILKRVSIEQSLDANDTLTEEELLLSAITQKSRWAEKEVLIFAGQMAIALDAIHSVNIVHVDFKPDNVFVDASGNYFLGDFGCALTLDEKTQRPLSVGNNFLLTSSQNGINKFKAFGSANMTNMSSDAADDAQHLPMTPLGETDERIESTTHHTAGALLFDAFHNSAGNSTSGPISVSQSLASQDEGDCRYVALDMINKKENYKAGDIFSLGMSLYELMLGEEPPRNGTKFEHMRKRTDLNELLERGYSPELVALVLLMLDPDPSLRPTAREILRFPLLQPSAETSTVLAQVGHIIHTCVPDVMPAKFMKSFLPSSTVSASQVFCAASYSPTQLLYNGVSLGSTSLHPSRIPPSSLSSVAPTSNSPDCLNVTAMGDFGEKAPCKHQSTDRPLTTNSPITPQSFTNITANGESVFSPPLPLPADPHRQCHLSRQVSLASENTGLSPMNECDNTIEPFYTTPLDEMSGGLTYSYGDGKQTSVSLMRNQAAGQSMSRPPSELLSEGDLLNLRYHKTCLEIAYYTMELLNRAITGVIPPARARFVKWNQEKERKIMLQTNNGNGNSGGAKGTLQSGGKPPRPLTNVQQSKGMRAQKRDFHIVTESTTDGHTPIQEEHGIHMSRRSVTTPTNNDTDVGLSSFQTPVAHLKSRRN